MLHLRVWEGFVCLLGDLLLQLHPGSSQHLHLDQKSHEPCQGATNHAGEPGFPGPGAGRSSLPQPGISGEHQTLPASPTSAVFSHQVQQKEGSDPQPPAAPAIPPPSTSHQRAAVAAAPHGSTSSFCVSFCREAPLWLHQPDPEDPL